MERLEGGGWRLLSYPQSWRLAERGACSKQRAGWAGGVTEQKLGLAAGTPSWKVGLVPRDEAPREKWKRPVCLDLT